VGVRPACRLRVASVRPTRRVREPGVGRGEPLRLIRRLRGADRLIDRAGRARERSEAAVRAGLGHLGRGED
jgi:hypothetical protein